MQNYITIKEIAAIWQIDEAMVARYCRQNRIPGTKKDGKRWLIPATATKPSSRRHKTNSQSDITKPPAKLPLPIGVSDYRRACKEYYYVDKTMMIKEILDDNYPVSLFTRPRRFGKTLNMDMLLTFFEKTSADTSGFFADKKIWQAGPYYQVQQGKYPVIYLTFKDIKGDTWEYSLDLLKSIIKAEFLRHPELNNSTKLSDTAFYKKIVTGTAQTSDYELALGNLSQLLYEEHGIAPVIIIDEYDTPIQQGYSSGYYEQVVRFMRNFFSRGLKDNKFLSYGFLTGILRVAKESIFSGLNNLKVYSILDNKYSHFFGFTSDEVADIAAYYGKQNKLPELAEWYDGYRFGDTDIYNPWSVINYFGNACQAMPYWVSTSNNSLIGAILTAADSTIYENLYSLLRGGTVAAQIDTSIIYPEMTKKNSAIYSFLLVTGYLKSQEIKLTNTGNYYCRLSLPNKEISCVYYKEILERFDQLLSPNVTDSLQNALFEQDETALQKYLQKFLLETVSYHDAMGESFYHGLLLGLCAVMTSEYELASNRESGEGRFDIQLMPKHKRLPGIIIEIKAAKTKANSDLHALAERALAQIHTKQYAANLKADDVHDILLYGIAFSGKAVELAVEKI
ncbi:MAG: AAA family ATPase [Phascolarctobacterium sp.]